MKALRLAGVAFVGVAIACGGTVAATGSDAGQTRTSGPGSDAGQPRTSGSGGTDASDTNPADGGQPVPSAYFVATSCGGSNLGPFGSPTAPAPSGGGRGNDTVTCSVQATGPTTYAVSLDVGEEFGAAQISGTVDSAIGAGAQIKANFDGLTGNYDYKSSDCIITLSSTVTPPIAPGRIAGTLSCPQTTDAGCACRPTTDAGCGAGPGATATFVFENCTQ